MVALPAGALCRPLPTGRADGKSDALLMSALGVLDGACEMPGYNAIIFRRTYRDLALPGAIMDRAAEWLMPTAASWDPTEKIWTFPHDGSGPPPRLGFGYLDGPNDHFRYAGAEYSRQCFDELTTLDMEQVRFVRSRLRRTQTFPLKPFSRAASNPGGRSHHEVFKRYVDPETSKYPFIPALISQNPFLYRDTETGESEYEKQLEDLDEVTKAQLLRGEWVVATQNLIYPFTDAHYIDEAPELDDQWHYILGVDLGTSLDKPTTALTVCGYHPSIERAVWVFESFAMAGTMTDIAHRIEEVRRRYGGIDRIVMDTGGLGGGFLEECRRRWAIPAVPAEKRDKQGFRQLIRGAIERLEISVVEHRCQDLVRECRRLRFDESGLKESKKASQSVHLSDSLLYAWRETKSWASRAPTFRHRRGTRAWQEDQLSKQLDKERRDLKREIAGDGEWFW